MICLDNPMDNINMSESSKHVGAKPRLSLFSSKQAVIRLKSDEQLDQQISNASPVVPIDCEPQIDRCEARDQTEAGKSTDSSDKETRLNGNTQQNDLNKMNISKEDLIRLLSMLKQELQSKEVALAAIKCEQLKRLINPIEISRSSLSNTYIKLQDRFKQKDQNNNNTKEKLSTQSPSIEQKNSVDRDQEGNHSGNDINEENLNILIALLELLDQHPLLALPRDSIYCLDYNCNELSTKNYLNLKIQHLDNLIEQHRRFRYYMTNRLQRSEQRLSEIAQQLEFERSLKLENGKTIYGATGETALLKRIEEVREALEKEKKDKQLIVMTLLNELLDEKERTNTLAEQLARGKSLQSTEQSDEKEKLLMLQSELDGLSTQLKKQANTFAGERDEMLSKMTALKNENESLKYKLDQLDKRPTPSPKLSQQETKETNRMASPSSPSKATSSKSINSSSRQQAIAANSPTATMRATKPSPQSRLSNSPNSTHTSTTAQISTQQSSSVRQTTTQTSPNSRSSGSPSLNKSSGGASSASDHHSTTRAQPLFKSASVLSTYQQTRGQRTSSNNNQLVRSTSTTQASVSKPQVPAKPAQLLDQQRGPH